jgi:hypothetical protein
MADNLKRLLAILAVGVLAVVAAPSPANADAFEWQGSVAKYWEDNNDPNCQRNYNRTAQGCFWSDGDWMVLGDLESDSMRVGIHWQTDYGRRGICYSTGQKDANWMDWYLQGGQACKINMAEGSKVRIEVGRCNGSATNCFQFVNWRDWSGFTPWLTI